MPVNDEFWSILNQITENKMEIIETPEFGKQQDMFIKPKRDFKESTKKTVPTGDKVYLQGLGNWKKSVFDEAIKTNAIVQRGDIWCIVTEEKTIFEDEKGHKLPSPYKLRVISQAYINLKNKYNI